MQNFLTTQNVVDFVAEHYLADIDKYPHLIYPEWDTMAPNSKSKLLEYVSLSGKFLLLPNSASLFKDELYVTFKPSLKVKNNGLAKDSEIFHKPQVTVTWCHSIDVTLNKKLDKLILNLGNTSDPQDNDKVMAFDERPCVGPLQITIHSQTKPKKEMLQPENVPLAYTYQDGQVRCTLPLLKVHEMVVLE